LSNNPLRRKSNVLQAHSARGLLTFFELCYDPQHAGVAEVVDARDFKFARKKF
jgi:hypothetical protein